jgi:small subunit ribosomal protein S20
MTSLLPAAKCRGATLLHGLNKLKTGFDRRIKGKDMANHKSAAKRARQTVKKNELNRSRRSKVRTLAKAVEKAVGEKNASDAKSALRTAESGLARAARKGTLHPKTASRKTSRLAKAVKKVALAGK